MLDKRTKLKKEAFCAVFDIQPQGGTVPFNQLIDGMLNAVIVGEAVCDEAGRPIDLRFITVNPAMASAFDTTPEKMAGRTVAELMPDIEPLWIESLGTVACSGRPAKFESVFSKAKRHFAVRAFSPAPGQFAAVFTDVTEQRKTEEALKLAQATLNAVGDAIYWLNRDGRFVFVNDSACAATGYSRAELLEMTVHDLNPNFPQDAWSAHWEQIQQKGSFNTESMHRRKDGSTYPVSVTASYVAYEGKTYNCAVARDISSLLRQEEERRQNTLLEATATLAGGIAHDFNNLMTAVLGNAEMLEETVGPDPMSRQMLADIIQAAERAGRLARQMLAFAGSGKLNVVRLNINKVIGECLQTSECTFSHRIRLETDLQGDLWSVNADTDQMRQVTVNLLSNAMEAIQSIGRVKIKTQNVSVDESYAKTHVGLMPRRYVHLRVHDDGMGMEPDVAARIFEPFYTTKFPGRGLGLSAVHGIVTKHDGNIFVQSEPGRGTVFDIYLPAVEPTDADRPESISVAPEPRGDETILIVEDETIVQSVTEKFLVKCGYRVLCAEDGREAVRMAETFEGEIHAIILDLEMPIMTGGEALPLLKKARPDAAVVIISGHAPNSSSASLFENGADAFVVKPFQLQHLVSVLQTALTKHAPSTPPVNPLR